jgi:hypothetical protein
MTAEAWVLVVSMTLNAAQAMWAGWLKARYHLVVDTARAVEKEAQTVPTPPQG